MGCSLEVVFGMRKHSSMWNSSRWGWAPQLSRSRRTFLPHVPARRIFWLSCFSHASKVQSSSMPSCCCSKRRAGEYPLKDILEWDSWICQYQGVSTFHPLSWHTKYCYPLLYLFSPFAHVARVAFLNHGSAGQWAKKQVSFIAVKNVLRCIVSADVWQLLLPVLHNTVAHICCLPTEHRPLDHMSLLETMQPSVAGCKFIMAESLLTWFSGYIRQVFIPGRGRYEGDYCTGTKHRHKNKIILFIRKNAMFEHCRSFRSSDKF